MNKISIFFHALIAKNRFLLLLWSCLLCVLLFYTQVSSAQCTAVNGWANWDQNYNIGNLVVQRDLPVGATIATIDIPLGYGGQKWASCTGGDYWDSGYIIKLAN